MALYANISKELEDKVIEVFKESESNICRIQCMITINAGSSTENTTGTSVTSTTASSSTSGNLGGWNIGGSGSATGSTSSTGSISSDGNVGSQITPLKIHNLSIIQHFEKEYMEKVTATFDLSIEEAITIVTNYQDLSCTMIFDHVTQHYYQVIDEIPSEIKEFKVLINSPEDIRKQLVAVQAMVKKQIEEARARGEHVEDDLRVMRYQLPVELVTSMRYALRERPSNFIMREGDLKKAVHLLANMHGIKKVAMVAPDNNKIYKNIFAPPMQTLGTYLVHLQNTYGIYSKGIGYYYDDKNETLRVYPLFETNPQVSQSDNSPPISDVQLWRLPNGSYPGSSSYHSVVGSTMSIILNDELATKELSEMGTEINGNLKIGVRSDTVVDVNTTQKGNEAEVNKDNQLLVGTQDEKVASTNRVVAKFAGNTNNAYNLTSEMASTMCLVMTAHWNMAWPWLLVAGHKVTYNYEDHEGLKQTTGIIAGVQYVFTAIAGVVTHELYYSSKSIINCRLASEKKEAGEGTALNTSSSS